MKINKSKIIFGIVILFLIFLMLKPIQENCFGEGKECEFLDEILNHKESIFLLVIIILGTLIYFQLNKILEVLKDTQDIIVTLENEN